jgi:hypothetical protein
LDLQVVPEADFGCCGGSSERETTLKDQCRQAETAENGRFYGQNRRIAARLNGV